MADFLTDMRDLIASNHVDDSTTEKIINEIGKTFGGGFIYVKKNTSNKIAAKHDQIRRKFTGNNHKQLCGEFDVTTSQIYRILKKNGNE